MKIANIERESQGHAMAYDENAFFNAAKELRELAAKQNKQYGKVKQIENAGRKE